MAKRISAKWYLPLVVLLVMAVFLLRGLWLDPKKLPSVLIDKPVPGFALPLLDVPTAMVGSRLISPTEFKGKPWVMNVFASWCQACVIEHPNLLKMANRDEYLLVGLAYKDDPDATAAWLRKHGNPYDLVLLDIQGGTGIDWGVYGVPETFVMNAENTIKHKVIGPVDAQFASQTLNELLKSMTGGKHAAQ